MHLAPQPPTGYWFQGEETSWIQSDQSDLQLLISGSARLSSPVFTHFHDTSAQFAPLEEGKVVESAGLC